MDKLEYKINPTRGMCAVVRCANSTGGRKLCSTCRSRKTRLADPVKYAFTNIRNRAKQRGIPFTITLEDFRLWAVKVNLVGIKRGRTADSWDIDRKHEDVGYHIDNIQVLEKTKNITKFFQYDWRRKEMNVMVIKDEAPEDLPF